MIEGHGYIDPNAEAGALARCGGPAICSVCQEELAAAFEYCAVKVEKGEEPAEALVLNLLRYAAPVQADRAALWSERYEDIWTVARSMTDWLCIHASDIGADGSPMVTLGNPATSDTVSGIARTLEQAYLSASFRALSIEAKRKAGK